MALLLSAEGQELVWSNYRAYFVEYYASAIVEYREKYQPGGPEVLLEIGGREALRYAFRLYRMDLASGAVDPPNFTEVNVDKKLMTQNLIVGPGMRNRLLPLSLVSLRPQSSGILFPGPRTFSLSSKNRMMTTSSQLALIGN